MGTVLAVCTSAEKGVQKRDVHSAHFTPEWGIDGDAHAGKWHRQVSLLSADKIEAFRAKGAEVVYGDFGENLVVSGFDFRSLPVGTLLRCGEVLLEMTQIGKECHSHCAIYKTMGDCIMPREGVFARVLEGGTITVGDEMSIVERTSPLPYQAAVITLSDKGAAGEREDKSGPAIVEELEARGYEVVEKLLLADGVGPLKAQLIRLCDQRQLDLILTTGGTGFTPRDQTPEATLAVADRTAPGIAEAIRADSMKYTKRAMFSRGVSVIRGKTLIINLPGSPKAVHESMEVFLDELPHALDMLRNTVHDCAR
ncbi:MAG TPA: MOSC domain-containing protein [Candidatus Scatomorpha gallistercoris]|nr:MOSC domain-containing protein [Candidatus Scatomorpha gallistercoris]